MWKKFTSRKFIIAVFSAIGIILNDGLDLGISQEAIVVAGGIIATWIAGESAVDISKKPKVSAVEQAYHGE